MTKKLKIIGPYTPEHPGPYTLDLPMLKGEEYKPITVHCVVDGVAFISAPDVDHPWTVETDDLLNAEEVPVAREFWINEYAADAPRSVVAYRDELDARRFDRDPGYLRTIHLREVLPEEPLA